MAENIHPTTAKFLAYPSVVVFISLNISFALCCFSTLVILGFTLEENNPIAAPKPYPEKLDASVDAK